MFLLWVLVPSLALVAPPSAARRASQRAEAHQAIALIAQGQQVEASLARLRYLGEEPLAFRALRAAFEETADDRVRRDIALALGALSRPGDAPALLSLLEDSDSAVRMHALKGLLRARSQHWAAVARLLEDESLGVRREAARALGTMKRRQLGRTLLEAARRETEPEVRAELLVAVGDSGDRRQIPGLQSFLESSSESARFAAARALCRLGAPSGLTLAGELLASSEAFARDQGLALLEGVPARVSGPLLRPLLAGADRRLAAKAARLLHQGGEPRMVEWLVLAAYAADAQERPAIERELEQLNVDAAARRTILQKAGVR